MDTTTVFGSTLNQLGKTVKDTAKQAVKAPKDIAETFGEQVNPVRTENPNAQQAQQQKGGWKSDEERQEFLRGLYGPSSAEQNASQQDVDKKKNTTSANPLVQSKETKDTTSANPLVQSQEKLTEFQQQISKRTPEEQKQLTEQRDQLNKEVNLDPTFNPPKKQEEEEERPAEKVEKEKQQEMMELQKKEEKKPTNWAVQREQHKTESRLGAG